MMEENSTQQNIEKGFQLAEKHLGVPQLLDVKELLEGTVDERSVVLYTSLFFHAFVSKEEKVKDRSEFDTKKQKMSEEMQLLQSQLEAVIEEKRVLEKNVEDLKKQNAELKETYEKQLHEKDDMIERLQHEKEDLENELREWKAKYDKLKEKVDERSQLELKALDVLRKNLIEHMNDMNIWKDYLEQGRDYEADKIQLRAENDIKDRVFEDQLAYLSGALESENRKLEVLLKQREIQQKDKKPEEKKPEEKKHTEKPAPKKKAGTAKGKK